MTPVDDAGAGTEAPRSDRTDRPDPAGHHGEPLPEWLRPVARLAARARPGDFGPSSPRPVGSDASRSLPSAVLVLFGDTPDGPDLVLIERGHTLRSHPGQPAFPGGRIDPEDAGPVAAALREAAEEAGVEPEAVRVFGTLPPLWVPPSGHVVTPVLGWWRHDSPIRVVDHDEVAAVHRVRLADLLEPAHRFRVRFPLRPPSSGGTGADSGTAGTGGRSGTDAGRFVGPAFGVAGMVVWGFTGGLLDRLFRDVGWERPWDTGRVRDLSSINAGGAR